MTYTAKNFEHLLGIKGLSEQLLKNHFTLYQGYVTNTNKLNETLLSMVKEGKTATPEFTELKRRFAWEFNGMRLHELYFENMSKTKKELKENSQLLKTMDESFSSGENCHKDFLATGSSRGIGWVIMYYDLENKKLFNTWINEHDGGHLSGCIPLLVMDVFEHAYMLDYGLKKIDYLNNFIEIIDWEVVEKRFEVSQK